MTLGLPSRRPGARALVAVLALVAVVWLNALPHRHSDDGSERHCPACQVVRGDGQPAPEPSAGLAPPPGAAEPIAPAVVEPVATVRHDGPPPGRSPPSSLS